MEKSAAGAENSVPSDDILITDVGSTTTKALLISVDDSGNSFFAGGVNVPTTVEKPAENVCIGISKALEELEKITGRSLTDSSGLPSVPYLTTSSAGGGLQMLVFGLTSVETGRIAEKTANNAGGVVLKTMSIDDGLQAVEKMLYIQSLHPDMIMLAGGTDGGAIAGVVRLAELLTLSDPEPKFKQHIRIPLVYCGNTEARSFVSEVLKDTFDIHIVENVRPTMDEMNMEPARKKVHSLFMENVMERAPGYSNLKELVISDILPTPAGVENVLRLYSDNTGENVILMDMGGATTDIFSHITGEYNRTVAANTGMSYSMANILAESGIKSVIKYLPGSFSKEDVRNYLYNKTVNPTYVPLESGEVLVEQAAAICGSETAWKQHLETCARIKKLGFLERLKKRNRKPFEETFVTSNDSNFNLSDIDMVIGAGGVVSNAKGLMAFRMLCEGFKPYGITCLAVDRSFRSPHLGVLSEIEPGKALNLFTQECLEKIGWVVAPFGRMQEGDTVLRVKNAIDDTMVNVQYGECLLLKNGGDLTFKTKKKTTLGRSDNSLCTELPVLVDCRGRGDNYHDIALSFSKENGFDWNNNSLKSRIEPECHSPVTGKWDIDYRLPYNGNILVKEGDRIEPGSVLGENRYDPPRIYILDLNKIPGYNRHLTPEEIKKGLLVKTGDKVKLNSALYEVNRKGLAGFSFTFRSPVRGRVSGIEENGMIILREIQDYDEKPHVIQVSKQLGIRSRHILGYLKKNTGDFVEAGQVIASDLSKGKASTVTSPTTGVIRKVDKKNGTVTVQYEIKPVKMKAHVSGTVSHIEKDRLVSIRGEGSRLQGVIGFGSTTSGILHEAEDLNNSALKEKSIVFSVKPINGAFLKRAAKAGLNGIVAPSISAEDWVKFNGAELGVAITGDEDIPFTMILTSGFGSFDMTEESAKFLKNSIGRNAGLSGRTQIRAGVTRPEIVI